MTTKPTPNPQPRTPGDPNAQPMTVTPEQLDALIAKRVSAAMELAKRQGLASMPDAKPLPTLEEAMAMVEADLQRDGKCSPVLTAKGFYVHPLANNAPEPARRT